MNHFRDSVKYYDYLVQYLKNNYKKYLFFDMSDSFIKDFVRKEISRRNVEKDDLFLTYIQNKFIVYLVNFIKKKLNDNNNFLSIVSNYICSIAIIPNSYTESINFFEKLQEFFTSFEFNLSPEQITELINGEQNFNNAAKTIVEKYGNKYSNYIDNDFIISVLHIYCMLNNIELEEIDLNNIDQDNIIDTIIDVDKADEKDLDINVDSNEDIIVEGYQEDFVRQIVIESKKHPLLTLEEEKKLFRAYKNGDMRARDRISECNQRLIISIVNKNIRPGASFLDLYQEANIGLLVAIDKFDETRDNKFSTYAIWWIRQYISRYIDDYARCVRIPVHRINLIKKMTRIENELSTKLGRKPTISEIAKKMDKPESLILELFENRLDIMSTNYKISDEDDTEFQDTIKSDDKLPYDIVSDKMLSSDILRLLDSVLTERQREVIIMRFGLNGEKSKTLEEIGLIYGITRERVRQIEKVALISLRKCKNAIMLSEAGDKHNEELSVIIPESNIISSQKKDYTIYSYLSKFPNDLVNKQLLLLPPLAKQILMNYFGSDFQSSFIPNKYDLNFDENIRKIFNYLRKKLMGQTVKSPQSLFKHFSNYTTTEVEKAIAKLTNEEKVLLKLKYGDNLFSPNYNLDWYLNSDNDVKFAELLDKITGLLPKKAIVSTFTDIYDYLGSYEKQKVDKVLRILTQEEVAILRLRFGHDFQSFNNYPDWSKEQEVLCNTIISKIKKNLNATQNNILTLNELFSSFSQSQIEAAINLVSNSEVRNSLISFLYNGISSKQEMTVFNKIKRPLLINLEKIKDFTLEITIYQMFKSYDRTIVDKIINTLTLEEINLLKMRFGNDFRLFYIKKDYSKEISHKISDLLEKITYLLKQTNNNKEVFSITIYSYFEGFKRDKIDSVINSLSEEEINLLKLRFGDSLQFYNESVIFSSLQSKAYNDLILKIKSLLNEEKITIKKITIYDYFKDYNKNCVDLVLSMLCSYELNLLKKKFGNELDNYVKRPNWINNESKEYNNLYQKMLRLLNKVKETNIIEDELQVQKTVSIYDYFKDYPNSLIDRALTFLTEEEMKYLKIKFGENLDQYIKCPNLGEAFSKKCSKILLKLKNKLISLKRIVVIKEECSLSIFEIFSSYTKEEVLKAISMLSYQERENLKIRYGNDFSSAYLKINKMSSKLRDIIKKIRNHLNLVHVDSTYELKKIFFEKNRELLYKINIINSDPLFINTLSRMERVDAIILELRFGIYGKIYNTSEIASLFNKTEHDILKLTRNALASFKTLSTTLLDEIMDIMETEVDYELLLIRKHEKSE